MTPTEYVGTCRSTGSAVTMTAAAVTLNVALGQHLVDMLAALAQGVGES